MKLLTVILCALVLGGCGPKEIGQGSSEEYEGRSGGHYGVAEHMRQPMTGMNNNERILYYYNRPEIMENIRNWRTEQFRRQAGLAPSPEDPAYREQPRQASPFRQ